MKPSAQPPLWLLFGAGGMLSALVGWMLVLITGIAAPLDLLSTRSLLSYDNVLAFARNPLGKAFVFAVVSLFMWHAAHRIFHTLHDFGIRTGAVAWIACYGLSLVVTGVAAWRLLALGF